MLGKQLKMNRTRKETASATTALTMLTSDPASHSQTDSGQRSRTTAPGMGGSGHCQHQSGGQQAQLAPPAAQSGGPGQAGDGQQLQLLLLSLPAQLTQPIHHPRGHQQPAAPILMFPAWVLPGTSCTHKVHPCNNNCRQGGRR